MQEHEPFQFETSPMQEDGQEFACHIIITDPACFYPAMMRSYVLPPVMTDEAGKLYMLSEDGAHKMYIDVAEAQGATLHVVPNTVDDPTLETPMSKASSGE
jgi:hypothetical protein